VGLGRLLLGELIALASARGVAALTGEALGDNTRMIELVRQLGFTVRPDPSDARTTLPQLQLQRAGCPVRHPGDNG
jgi:acetyltransferase